MGRNTILVTGGTGFVGSHVIHAILNYSSTAPADIRVLSRRPLLPWMTGAGVVGIRGDLSTPARLRGICDGVGTLLHLAAAISHDPDECHAVNVDGTLAMLAEARRAGTERVVYLSTTSVYGNGAHRGVTESAPDPAPVSPTSRTKLTAERAVRDMGGVALRPHLTYGPGDRWFVPALLRLLDRVPAWVDDGAALMSVVSVQDLARVLAEFAKQAPWKHGAVYHVTEPRPVPVRSLARRLCEPLGVPLPTRSLSSHVHREVTRQAMPTLTDHQFSLLTEDHWYESSRLWHTLDVTPTDIVTADLREALSWYRTLLGAGLR